MRVMVVALAAEAMPENSSLLTRVGATKESELLLAGAAVTFMVM